MGKAETFWQRLSDAADLGEESLIGQVIVEITGENRVLIENHMGVKGYSREKIVIRVRYGYIHVCGEHLELIRMSRDTLVIRGKILQVCLNRRK